MSATTPRTRRPLGLSPLAIIGLALLAVPRVILHDLDLIREGTFVNLLFVFVPVAIWILVAVLKRLPNPFVTLLVVGAIYGVLLASAHQLLWDISWGDREPQLGGNLSDLPPVAEALILRGFAAISSLFTGVIVGAIAGLVAWGITALARPRGAS